MKKNRQHGLADLFLGIILGAIVVVAVGATGYHLTYTRQAVADVAGLPSPVQTEPAAVRVLHETVGAAGMIQPSRPVTLTAKVVSRVLAVPVDLGAIVRPGQVLVRFDPRIYRANLDRARAAYEHSHRQLQRMQSLMRRNFASAVDLEKARNEDAAARDALLHAEIDLSNTRVVSPVSGVVLERGVNPGEDPKTDQTLLVVGVLDPVMMVAQVSEDKLGEVYVGMQGTVGTDAFPDLEFTGSVDKIDFRVNDSTRTFSVFIRIPNHALRLTKGVTGYSRLESTRMALTIPSTAIMNPLGDKATVFVIDKDDKTELREIRCGAAVGNLTEVMSGLNEKDRVVTVGQAGLRDHELVTANHSAPWNEEHRARSSRGALREAGAAMPPLITSLMSRWYS